MSALHCLSLMVKQLYEFYRRREPLQRANGNLVHFSQSTKKGDSKIALILHSLYPRHSISMFPLARASSWSLPLSSPVSSWSVPHFGLKEWILSMSNFYSYYFAPLTWQSFQKEAGDVEWPILFCLASWEVEAMIQYSYACFVRRMFWRQGVWERHVILGAHMLGKVDSRQRIDGRDTEVLYKHAGNPDHLAISAP